MLQVNGKSILFPPTKEAVEYGEDAKGPYYKIDENGVKYRYFNDNTWLPEKSEYNIKCE